MVKKTKARRATSYGANKAPYVYSNAYHAWRRIRLGGDDRAIQRAAQDHARQFGYSLGERAS